VRRQKEEKVMRYLLAFMLAACITPIIFAIFGGSVEPIVEEPTETTITTETTTTTTTMEVTTITTTAEGTTTTTSEVTSTTDMRTTEVTVTSTSYTSTTETKSLLTYDILQRIEMINILLDESKYSRLLKKAPENLTSDERLELYYYNSLATERKHLREYLDKNK